MSAKAIREASGKQLLNRVLTTCSKSKFASVDESTDYEQLLQQNPWLKESKLVVKPDQLIKRRGKLGLLLVNADFKSVQEWINQRIGKDTQVLHLYTSSAGLPLLLTLPITLLPLHLFSTCSPLSSSLFLFSLNEASLFLNDHFHFSSFSPLPCPIFLRVSPFPHHSSLFFSLKFT